MSRVKFLPAKVGEEIGISVYPNFSASGNVYGMKHKVYGKNALLVRCGSYIYNVTSNPRIYYNEAY